MHSYERLLVLTYIYLSLYVVCFDTWLYVLLALSVFLCTIAVSQNQSSYSRIVQEVCKLICIAHSIGGKPIKSERVLAWGTKIIALKLPYKKCFELATRNNMPETLRQLLRLLSYIIVYCLLVAVLRRRCWRCMVSVLMVSVLTRSVSSSTEAAAATAVWNSVMLSRQRGDLLAVRPSRIQ